MSCFQEPDIVTYDDSMCLSIFILEITTLLVDLQVELQNISFH